MTNRYDAIVIGARCAGSPTAMLLARRGYRVLVVDKATFPSDTLSTHMIHAPGVAALRRWGLADQVADSNCPAITTYRFDFGPFTVSGSPRPVDGNADAFAPRRQVLDTLLVEAAAKAGAEVRQGFTVDEILIDDGVVTGIRGHDAGGVTVTEHAPVVIGADGRHSLVAKAVQPARYNERPVLMSPYYTYWSGVPFDTFTVFSRDHRGFGVFPTNDDLTLIVVGWPNAEFQANRGDVEGNYLKTIEEAPEMADRVRAGQREERFHGSSGEPNFYRKPFGPGWVLVGDAGYLKDPITAQGISDAFRDVELVVDGLDDTFCGRRPFDEAMTHYQQVRDEHTFPLYDFTCQLASMEPPPPEMQHLLGAVSASPAGGDGFASMVAGTMPVPEFFSPDNIGRIMAAN
jgi:2-polyprenyl-6-methoxyphenol hydroxylase-like FAD-dependent oxidoreductase